MTTPTPPNQGEKLTVYSVEDKCETPMLYDDLKSAIEYLKECLDCIDFGYEISIKKVEMTKKEFEAIPEF